MVFCRNLCLNYKLIIIYLSVKAESPLRIVIKYLAACFFLFGIISGVHAGSASASKKNTNITLDKKLDVFVKKYGCPQSETPLLKRKYKPRGVEVTVPEIIGHKFNQDYQFVAVTFEERNFLFIASAGISSYKRGPPLI